MNVKKLALVVVFVSGAVCSGDAQSDSDPRWNYFSVRSRLTVTIKQDGAELATLTFPASTFVSVSDGTTGVQRNAFHGNVEIRGRVKSDKTVGSAASIMSDAPLILKASDVDVQVRND